MACYKRALGIIFLLCCSGCSQQQNETALPQQSMLAVNWMQESGEYEALSWQAFNLARLVYDSSVITGTMKKAVIVDIDETVLDNSAYQAWLIRTNKTYSDETWNEWVNDRSAVAMPGAVEFAMHVVSSGGRVFYISNRDISTFPTTAANLINQGFPDITSETLLLMKDHITDKSQRIKQVLKNGFIPVLFMGDNLNDFTSDIINKTAAERHKYVKQHHDDFGTRFIILPNPSYGDWESSLDKNYKKLNPREKIIIRDVNLHPWYRAE